MKLKPFKATVDILVEAIDEEDADSRIEESLTAILQNYKRDSSIIDWQFYDECTEEYSGQGFKDSRGNWKPKHPEKEGL